MPQGVKLWCKFKPFQNACFGCSLFIPFICHIHSWSGKRCITNHTLTLLSSLLVLLYTVWVMPTKWDRVGRLSLHPSSTYHPLFYFVGSLHCTYHPFVLHRAAFTLITLQQSVVIRFLTLQRSVILCFFSLVFTSANPSRFLPFQFRWAHQAGGALS